MRIAVTGGSGKLGRFVLRELASAGHDVLNLDRVGERGDDFVPVDLADYGQVADALLGTDEKGGGFDAVVHLAAIPAPGMRTNAETFRNNMLAGYNVLSAAVAVGVRRVVHASSETVLGLPFDTPPPYIPVDEEYHPRPESTYSLVKTLEEEMSRQYARRFPDLRVIALRFSNVMAPEDYDGFGAFQDDPLARKWNLWGYIDARDGAQAVRLAVEGDEPGFDRFIIAAEDTVMQRPSAELAAEVFPDVPVRREVRGNETLLSIDHAREKLGYRPQHSWRDPR